MKVRKLKHNSGTTILMVIAVLLILAVVSIGVINNSIIIGNSQKASDNYKISQNGTIGETVKLAGTALEKYIFGEDLQGRDISEIMDMDEKKFDNTDVQFVTYGLEITLENSERLYGMYLKYDNETYKFKLVDNEGVEITQPSYGLTKIEVNGEKVGKTVSYDGRTWTILYDDATNGLQMICNETYQYNGEDFYLGDSDSLITDWNFFIKVADLDGDGKLSDLEKSIHSYNNAITTLNTACESVVSSNDNITDVRCVGSNPTNKKAENGTLYISDNLAKWPESDSTYSAGIGNGKGKSTDSNYVTDMDRMVALGIHIAVDSDKNNDFYWLASRFVGKDSSWVLYGVRHVYSDGSYFGDHLWSIEDRVADMVGDHNSLRPIVYLSSSVELTEAGAGVSTDYVL